MMKKYILMFITLAIILGFFTGIYMYKINNMNNKSNLNYVSMTVDDECTEIADLEDNGLLDLAKTNAEEEKISPNAILTKEIYYKKCGHLISATENISKEYVNLNKEELMQMVKDWEIEDFSANEITLYKESDDFCNEHYILKEENGYIAIYKLDENNNETLEDITEISTEYLTQTDLNNIEKGIEIYTKQELNKKLEDFE